MVHTCVNAHGFKGLQILLIKVKYFFIFLSKKKLFNFLQNVHFTGIGRAMSFLGEQHGMTI